MFPVTQIRFYSPKGGQGVTTVAALTAIGLASNPGHRVLFVSPRDGAAVLGCNQLSDFDSVNMVPHSGGGTLALSNIVHEDAVYTHIVYDKVLPLVGGACSTYLVLQPCYMALRLSIAEHAGGVVYVDRPGSALTDADVERAVGIPIVARMPHDQNLARAVDAGLLCARGHKFSVHLAGCIDRHIQLAS